MFEQQENAARAIEKRSIHDLISEAEPHRQAEVKLLLDVLSEFYRDYHDYKGSLPHDLDYVLETYIKASPEDAEFARKSLRRSTASQKLLRSADFKIDSDFTEAFDVFLEGRNLVYLIPYNVLIAFGDPPIVYSN